MDAPDLVIDVTGRVKGDLILSSDPRLHDLNIFLEAINSSSDNDPEGVSHMFTAAFSEVIRRLRKRVESSDKLTTLTLKIKSFKPSQSELQYDFEISIL